jgi:signal transduction histidine kinase
MFARLTHIQLLRYAGLFTWGMVGLPMALITLNPPGPEVADVAEHLREMWLAWLVFGLAYARITRALGQRSASGMDQLLLAVMTASAIAVGHFSESGLGSMLLMVGASVVPWLLSLRAGIAWLVLGQLVLVPVFLIDERFVFLEAVMQSLLYAGFAGFVYATSLVARQQAQAREEQRRLNSELRATRALLAESVRVNERTRISRELHDLLGHHLTALSLNLEVAHHLVEGKALEHVAQSRTLAKLLLSDVREAVSQIRESDAIDMATTLRPLADNVPGLQVEMRLPEPFLLDDAERAHVLLRCTQEIITNVVRHAQATRLRLTCAWVDKGLRLLAEDDGIGAEVANAGNGLRGMRERLAACGGTVEIRTAPGEGFALELFLPVAPVAPPRARRAEPQVAA